MKRVCFTAVSFLFGLLLVSCNPASFDDTPIDHSSDQDQSGEQTNDDAPDSELVKILSTLDLVSGKNDYDAQCLACHGATGEGGIGGSIIACDTCSSFSELSNYIHISMPQNDVAMCVDSCANNVAGFMLNGYSTELSSGNDSSNDGGSTDQGGSSGGDDSANDDDSSSDDDNSNQGGSSDGDDSANGDDSSSDDDNSNQGGSSDGDDSANGDDSSSDDDNSNQGGSSDGDDSANGDDSTSDDDNSNQGGSSDGDDSVNGDDSSSDDDSSNQGGSSDNNDSALAEILKDLDLVSGAADYNAQCANCHGSQGEGGIGGELIACDACGSFAELTENIYQTMPYLNASQCIDECADNVTGYILNGFSSNLSDSSSEAENKTQYRLKTLPETLRKFSIAAINRMPTADEFTQAETEQGFDSVVRQMMTEDAFGDWIKITYNDLLLTNKYERAWYDGARTRDPNNDRKYLINVSEYLVADTDIENADDGVMTSNQYYDSRCINALLNWSIQQEPLELVKYIAMNDLPVEEMITADYRMVNYYLQRRIYGGLKTATEKFTVDDFKRIEYSVETFDIEVCYDYKYSHITAPKGSHYYDANDFLPAIMPRPVSGAESKNPPKYTYADDKTIPLAGVLTSELFLHRYPTNSGNRNRLRAATLFKYFLDEDIGASQIDEIESGDFTNPVLENPSCTACHNRLDPVAAAFHNWGEDARYMPHTFEYTGDYHEIKQQQAHMPLPIREGMLSPGFGDVVLAESDYDNALQLVAKEVVKETRKYRSAVIRTLYNGLLGRYDNPTYFRQLYDQFESEGVDTSNMRELVLALIKLDDYRIDGVLKRAEDEGENVRSIRLVTAELMDRKVHAVTNLDWDVFSNNSMRVLFGGIDSDSYTTRFTQVSGVSEALTETMAAEMACRAVTNDFRKDPENRLLFPHVEMSDQPESAGEIALIKENLQHLHNWVLQEELTLADSEINYTYQIFERVYQHYKSTADASLAEDCVIGAQDPEYAKGRDRIVVYVPEEKRIYSDPNFTIKAWIAVMQYLMLDSKFLHE